MEYKQYILSKVYVGEIFKYALSKNIDVYKFILEFLKSDFKKEIDLGLVDFENLEFENNDKLTCIISKIHKCNNKEYKKMILYNIYDFSNIIAWIGETLQCWTNDLKKDGVTLSKDFNLDIFKKMISCYSYLYYEDSLYIYYEIYSISNKNVSVLTRLFQQKKCF